MIPIVIDTLGTVSKGLVHGVEDLEIRGRMETIQTIDIGQYTKIPGELRRLAVTQIPVENYHLKLEWKILIIMIIMIIIFFV